MKRVVSASNLVVITRCLESGMAPALSKNLIDLTVAFSPLKGARPSVGCWTRSSVDRSSIGAEYSYRLSAISYQLLAIRMLTLPLAVTARDFVTARRLLRASAAYLPDHQGSDAALADVDNLPGPYLPPAGGFYLAALDGEPVGCVALARFEIGRASC